jgi:hypothetical protein
MLVKDGYKGSGDYGVCIWVYNGQKPNRTEGNRNPRGNQSKLSVCHSSQIIEPGIQAYTGKWALEAKSPGVTVKDKQYTIDQRVAATLYCIQNHLVSKQNIILVKDLVITN